MAADTAIPDLSKRRFWSLKEAASYLECHPWTLQKRLKGRNGVPHKRLGRKILIPIEEFVKWADQKQIP